MKFSIETWADARAAAQPIRYQVFCTEQSIPIELESDDKDVCSLHCVARDDTGRAVGTGRLLPSGHIGRMAVLAQFRRQGIGKAILGALVEQARKCELKSVMLHAQTHAMRFYAAEGFAVEGPEFMEAGIAHCVMRRVLD